jgi:two-component system cell cycle sensor histidine kinase/response regulator CckA
VFPNVTIGTSFCTDLTMPNTTKNNTEAKPPRSKHILVVDDEQAIRKLAKRILTVKGYDVTTCSNGAKAVDAYSRLYDQIDLVILDMIMPEMNGVETLRNLKQIDPTVRAILCSAFVPDLDRETISDEGFAAFMSKPFKVNELLAMAADHTK